MNAGMHECENGVTRFLTALEMAVANPARWQAGATTKPRTLSIEL